MADEKEMLLVQSKIREVIRAKDLRVSDDFLTALNEHVHNAVVTAMARAKENGRQTLRPADV
jgi:hypothetical protein